MHGVWRAACMVCVRGCVCGLCGVQHAWYVCVVRCAVCMVCVAWMHGVCVHECMCMHGRGACMCVCMHA